MSKNTKNKKSSQLTWKVVLQTLPFWPRTHGFLYLCPLLDLCSKVLNLLFKVFVLFCLLDISYVGHVDVCLQICHLHL